MPARGDLHIGVVGVGRIGAFHARTLLSLEGVGAVTVTDADPERARGVAGAGFADSPAALVARGIDAVVIATTTAEHAPMLRLAADAGLPAFCEKPVALDLGVMDSVLEDVARAGTLVQVGYQRRFDAGYGAARAAVADGRLGTLLALRAATHDSVPPSEKFIAVSGGIFRDLLIHDFDAIRFVTGGEIVEVYAEGAVREIPWFERYGDVDTAVAVLRLSGGALAIVSGARCDPVGYDARLELFGTGDSLSVGTGTRAPLRSVEPGADPPGEPYRNFMDRFELAYRSELAAFVDAVRHGGRSACPLGEARAALLVALAADRSRAVGRPVSIDQVALARATPTG